MFAGPQHLHGRTKRLHHRPAAFRVDVIHMNAVEGRAVGHACISLQRLVCLQPFISQEWRISLRSEEHTSELQSLMRISYAVFCLKKKKPQKNKHIIM